MNNNPKEVLVEVFSSVLESLAFMFGEVVEDEPLPFPGRALRASIDFTGPFQGTLFMCISAEMCSEVAANMLGLEPDDELAEARAQDAVKELLNVACGHVLTELAGEGPVFDLTVPRVEPMEEVAWRDLSAAKDGVLMAVEDYPVLIQLQIR